MSRSQDFFHFRRDPGGKVTGFVLDAGRTLGMVFTRGGGPANEVANEKP